jgi:hypothetical protein
MDSRRCSANRSKPRVIESFAELVERAEVPYAHASESSRRSMAADEKKRFAGVVTVSVNVETLVL